MSSFHLREYAYLRADPCSYCGGPGGTIDHIIPAARGGLSTSDNLTGSCEACNLAKGAWPLLPFLLLRAWSAP
jgi:5-methylcytosine-specific restriction endonuclease McrA